MVGANGFVNHIPRMDASLVTAGNRLYVRAQQSDGVFRLSGRLKPVGIVLMPAEIVAAYGSVVGLGKIHEAIRSREIKPVLLRMRGSPLHLILGHQDRALLAKQRAKIGALELRIGNSRAKEKMSARRDLPQRVDRSCP